MDTVTRVPTNPQEEFTANVNELGGRIFNACRDFKDFEICDALGVFIAMCANHLEHEGDAQRAQQFLTRIRKIIAMRGKINSSMEDDVSGAN